MPDSVPLPLATLQVLLRLAQEGVSPRIHWSESREAMDRAAMTRRTELFTEIENELETLLPRP